MYGDASQPTSSSLPSFPSTSAAIPLPQPFPLPAANGQTLQPALSPSLDKGKGKADGEATVGEAEPERKKRKKASRACHACQRAHLTCDDGRPCERCIKRGCADTCQDGRRKKAKYLRDIDDDLVERRAKPPPTNAAASTSSQTLDSPGINVETAVYDSFLPPPPAEQPLSVNPDAFDPNLYTNFANQFGSEGATLEYSILSSMLSGTGYVDPNSINGADPLQALRPPSPPFRSSAGPLAHMRGYEYANGGSPASRGAPSPATSTGSAGLSYGVMRPDEVYTAITQPYPYAQSYHDLIRHLKEKFARADILRVVRALARFRPSLIALQMPLSAEDEIFVEKCFQRTLIEYERLISMSGTPTVVWRRTCEICLVGPEFCMLTGWKREDLLSRKRYIFELFDNASVVEYYEQVAAHAFENTTQTVMTTCNLLTPSGKLLPCSFCFSIKRDLFSVPSLIIGQFLPQVR